MVGASTNTRPATCWAVWPSFSAKRRARPATRTAGAGRGRDRPAAGGRAAAEATPRRPCRRPRGSSGWRGRPGPLVERLREVDLVHHRHLVSPPDLGGEGAHEAVAGGHERRDHESCGPGSVVGGDATGRHVQHLSRGRPWAEDGQVGAGRGVEWGCGCGERHVDRASEQGRGAAGLPGQRRLIGRVAGEVVRGVASEDRRRRGVGRALPRAAAARRTASAPRRAGWGKQTMRSWPRVAPRGPPRPPAVLTTARPSGRPAAALLFGSSTPSPPGNATRTGNCPRPRLVSHSGAPFVVRLASSRWIPDHRPSRVSRPSSSAASVATGSSPSSSTWHSSMTQTIRGRRCRARRSAKLVAAAASAAFRAAREFGGQLPQHRDAVSRSAASPSARICGSVLWSCGTGRTPRARRGRRRSSPGRARARPGCSGWRAHS